MEVHSKVKCERGHRSHATEARIYTAFDEPPSPKGSRKLITKKRLEKAVAKFDLTRHARLASVFLAVAVGGASLYTSWRVSAAPLASEQQEKISYALGSYFDLSTLQPIPVDEGFLSVAVAGINTGGSSSNLLATGQYVVKGGDTLKGVAEAHDRRMGTLILANADLKNDQTIYVGQILNIPAEDASEEELEKEWQERQKKAVAVAKQATAQSATSAAGTKKAASIASTPTIASSDKCGALGVPTNYTYISQYFSYAHQGIDMVAPSGTPIRAVADGKVLFTKSIRTGYGVHVAQSISGTNCSALYAHMTKFTVSSGESVSRGQVIGYVGNTGRSTGTHLHFELRLNGVATNPKF